MHVQHRCQIKREHLEVQYSSYSTSSSTCTCTCTVEDVDMTVQYSYCAIYYKVL